MDPYQTPPTSPRVMPSTPRAPMKKYNVFETPPPTVSDNTTTPPPAPMKKSFTKSSGVCRRLF